MNEVQRINPQALMNLPGQSPRESLALTLAKNGSSEISVFGGEAASVEQIAVSVRKLSVAFPQMSQDFFNLLTERIVKTGMSNKRLSYAVNRVIDTFSYKQLNIADVLNADVKCRMMSYSEMCNDLTKRGTTAADYAPIYIGDSEKPAWVLRVDKIRYNLPDRM